MEVILHRAKRIDNDEEVIGFITKMFGQYHIVKENDENTAYPIKEETIMPCVKTKEIKSVKYENVQYLSLWKLIELNIFYAGSTNCVVFKNSKYGPVIVYKGKLSGIEREYCNWKVERFYFSGRWRKTLNIRISELN